MGTKAINQENLFSVGSHQLKNGWVLEVAKYEGHYKIHKPNVYGVWCDRITGGQFGSGYWDITYSPKSEESFNWDYVDMPGGFTLEAVNNVIDKMEELMVTHNINDYNFGASFISLDKRIAKKSNSIMKKLVNYIRSILHKGVRIS